MRRMLGVPPGTATAACQVISGLPPLRFRRDVINARITCKRHAYNAEEPADLAQLRASTVSWKPRPPSRLHGLRFFEESAFAVVPSVIHASERLIPPPTPINPNTLFDIDWLPHSKKDTDPTLLRILGYERLALAVTRRQIVLYTDGTHDPNTLESAYGVFCSVPNLCASRKMTTGAGILSAELAAIRCALDLCSAADVRACNIASDSLTALKLIRANNGANACVNIILTKCEHIDVTFIWVPSHVGICGNENADTAAKAALSNATCPLDVGLPLSDTKTVISKIMLDQWQQSWANDSTGRSAAAVITAPTHPLNHWSLRRPLFCAVNRLLCNRAPFNSFLHLIQVLDSPNCTACHVPETSYHFLMTCCRFDLERLQLSNTLKSLKIPFTFRSVLGAHGVSPASRSLVYTALENFIVSTVGFSKLNNTTFKQTTS